MPNAAKVKGRFEQVKRDVYRKVGKPGKWLFVDACILRYSQIILHELRHEGRVLPSRVDVIT